MSVEFDDGSLLECQAVLAAKFLFLKVGNYEESCLMSNESSEY